MSIRKLNLDEWFLYYQLKFIQNHHFHLVSVIEADMTVISDRFPDQKLPLTYLLIKAMGLTLKHHPGINVQFVHSLWGPRMQIGTSCAVNVPVMLTFDGQDYLSVTTIKEADTKSIADIKAEVNAFRQTPKQDLKVGKYIIGQPNTFLNRLRLKCIHFVVNRFPSISDRFGVGMASVSSLLNLPYQGTDILLVGRGPGAFSITATHYDAITHRIRLSLAWDHYTGPGLVGAAAAMTLCRILQGELELESLLAH